MWTRQVWNYTSRLKTQLYTSCTAFPRFTCQYSDIMLIKKKTIYPFLLSRNFISWRVRFRLSVSISMSSKHPPGPRASYTICDAALAFSCRGGSRNTCGWVGGKSSLQVSAKILYKTKLNFKSQQETHCTLDSIIHGCFGHVFAPANLHNLRQVCVKVWVGSSFCRQESSTKNIR